MAHETHPPELVRGLLIRSPETGWARRAHDSLLPGAHAAVFGGFSVPLEAEDAQLVVRDCLSVVGPVRHQVWLIRRPLSEPTVAAQVLRTATGALWIEGCRIDCGGANYSLSYQEGKPKTGAFQTHKNVFHPGIGGVSPAHPAGRWPPNLLLVHMPGCRIEGTRKVKGGTAVREKGVKLGGYGGDLGKLPVGTPNLGYTDEDGLETIPAWQCEPGCPVPALDHSSGLLHGNALKPGHRKGSFFGVSPTGITVRGQHKEPPKMVVQNFYGGEGPGGASRFYPQFANEFELDAWLLRLLLGPAGEEGA